jgi:hypothetical protein
MFVNKNSQSGWELGAKSAARSGEPPSDLGVSPSGAPLQDS